MSEQLTDDEIMEKAKEIYEERIYQEYIKSLKGDSKYHEIPKERFLIMWRAEKQIHDAYHIIFGICTISKLTAEEAIIAFPILNAQLQKDAMEGIGSLFTDPREKNNDDDVQSNMYI